MVMDHRLVNGDPADNSDDALRRKCLHLEQENARLRSLLADHGIASEAVAKTTQRPAEPTSNRPKLGTAEKIALFKSLFRGREDVYAQRWESPDGRSGYSPRTERDWRAYNAAKPEDRKRVDKETRKNLPLTDEAIHGHLTGKQTLGVYPLLLNETCWFLAVDFDKKTWKDDASAFLSTCRELNVPVALECSRSGNGAHIWFFFDRPVPAGVARRLGTLLLTRTMERRHQLGLDSYDRFFPNQDTMPKGGFGNLIALPLQKVPRESGFTEFLDNHLRPHADQWSYLASIQRVSQLAVERLISEALRQGDLVGVRIASADDEDHPDPWTLPPSRRRPDKPIKGSLPSSIEIVRSNLIFIEKKALPPEMLNRLLRIAAFQNPEFYKAQAMRLSTFDKPRVIACGEDLPRHIALPRGCLGEALALIEGHGIKTILHDERFAGIPIDAEFHGTLRATQEEAVVKVTPHDDGLICAPTAFGKTAVAAWLIAKRKTNTLVMVHRQQLLDQWRERLAMFLEIPIDEIGQIGGGKTKRTGRIDVAVIQSLHREREVKDFVAEYGHVIVDECHHLSAFTFERVMRQINARFVVGLTATPTRKDGHHPIIYMQCGPTRFSLGVRAMTDSTPFDHIVVPQLTDFRMPGDGADATIQDIYSALVTDEARNESIVRDVIHAVQSGRSPLVLTSRTEHLSRLESALTGKIRNIIVLKGGMGRKQRRSVNEVLAGVPDGEQRLILATGSYIGEGFDDARLDTLFLAMPISWRGTLQQYVGRLHRLHDNKRVVEVYDYVDANVRMLARMYDRRLKGYGDMGYKVLATSQRRLNI
jgi:superfamily II DNA or RNA helicase